MLAYLDVFQLLAISIFCAVPFVLLLRPGRPQKGAVAH
jgi:hypothetical protein